MTVRSAAASVVYKSPAMENLKGYATYLNRSVLTDATKSLTAKFDSSPIVADLEDAAMSLSSGRLYCIMLGGFSVQVEEKRSGVRRASILEMKRSGHKQLSKANVALPTTVIKQPDSTSV